jgi:hypothetical protein
MKMTTDDLLTMVEEEERTSLAYLAGELSDQRSANMELFMGEKTRELTVVEGRSSVVSMDVMEAVESILPGLLKVFTSGDEVVRFDPKGAEDVKPAEQETDYVNYVVTQQNNWFVTAYQWFKDSMINKNAYVKFWWDTSIDVTEESYQGLTDQELELLQQDEAVEIIEHTQYPDEQAVEQLQQQAEQGDQNAIQALQTGNIPFVHDVRVKRETENGKVKIEPCAPEQILISADERSISPNDIKFFEHRTYKTISELREMGYDVDDDIADTDELQFTPEWLARQQFVEDQIFSDSNDKGANRRIVYRECYYKVDFDGDGIAERRHICIVGKEILNNETVDIVPFAALTPYLMPHMHIGQALADYVKDIMLIKSTVLRNVMDNFYAQNNTRTAVSSKVNLDDLLVSRPGGIVRVDGNPAAEIMQMMSNPIGPAAFPLLEYLDNIKETRTGITKYNQGMDSNSLNKTASGISQIMTAAQQRQELIARTFAETGVKQLFLGVHKLILQHSKKEQIVRLRNEWVPVDPRQWQTRTDMTVTVGLGNGNKDQQLGHIMQILTVMKEAKAGGLPIVNDLNLYNAVTELTKNAGYKDADKFWTNPANVEPSQPVPDPNVELKQKELQDKQQAGIAKFQLDAQNAEREHQLAIAQQQLERDKLQLEREKLALEARKVGIEAQLSGVGLMVDAASKHDSHQHEMSQAMMNGNFNDN